jgi:glycine cleavage system aminomethyltransferase T
MSPPDNISFAAQARTPLHHWHQAHGARFSESAGWHLPAAYTGVQAEVAAARSGLGLADLSAFAKLSLLGSGVPVWWRSLVSEGSAARPLAVAALPDGLGLACRLTADHLLLLGASPAVTALEKRLASLAAESSVIRSDVTCAWAAFGLVGPHIEEVLVRLISLPMAVLPPGACAETALAGVHALLVRPPDGNRGEVRILVAWDLAEYVWSCLLDAGRGRGIVPVGLEALRALA